MNVTPGPRILTFSRFKLFLALSRTPHGLLDMATPALSALLELGVFPSMRVISLGLITVFAGYSAVYALNDVMDYRADKGKIEGGGFREETGYLDALFVRHPMARGLLGLSEGFLWMAGWTLLALIGAYMLNPTCAILFIIGFVLEAVYCLMQRISHLRTLIHGVVKTLGAIAAVFAVDPHPSPLFLVVLFLWLFFWEIGGQNIPADWHDFEEDMRFQAKTLPLQLGLHRAGMIILGSLFLSVVMSGFLFWLAPAGLPIFSMVPVFGAGVYLLISPAFRLYRTKARSEAAKLFNQASYYPLTVLVIVLILQIL
jgi:4-hydroxybenzoate polyprenyltransferase